MSFLNYCVFAIIVVIICFILAHYCFFSHAAQRERNARDFLYRLHKDVNEATAFPDRGRNHRHRRRDDDTTGEKGTTSSDNKGEEKKVRSVVNPLSQPPPLLPALRYTKTSDIESILDIATVGSQHHRRFRRNVDSVEVEPPEKKSDEPVIEKEEDDDGNNNDDKSSSSPPLPVDDYVNPIASIEPLTIEPQFLRDYVLSDEPRAAENGGGTGIYNDWWNNEREYASMIAFQHLILRYVTTESNNELKRIDAYVRAVAILRDFARRFLAIAKPVAIRSSASTERIAVEPWRSGGGGGNNGTTTTIDWRLFVSMAAAHFAQCVRFVRDRSVHEPAMRCMDLVASRAYGGAIGRADDKLDTVTAYRLCNAWILAQTADRNSEWWRDPAYHRLLRTVHDRIAGEDVASIARQWLYYEPPAVDAVVRLRDHGRLLQGTVPFYGDLWHKYVHTRNLRTWDKRLDAYLAKSNDFAPLHLLVHTQVPYACFGLFGPGPSIPSHWVWPNTRLGVAVIPSIGLLRMYHQRFAFSCRAMKEHLPFYAYRPGQFDLRLMHIAAQQRMFVLLGDRDLTSPPTTNRHTGIVGEGDDDDSKTIAAAYQPGCIVLDDEDEQWVLNNCRVRREGGDLVTLYPLRASGTVMSTTSIGLMLQRYEMFRGLMVEEWLMLEHSHNRMYLHVTVNNRTERTATFYTSAHSKGTMRRIPAGTSASIYAYADFDDQALQTRLLCNPMQLDAFLSESQEPITYTSFLENGCLYYALSAEDGTRHVYVLSRDNMLEMPNSIKCRDRTYTFQRSYNQHVYVTDRLRPR